LHSIGEAKLIGATARAVLASGFAGRVLAVVTDAVYVIARSGPERSGAESKDRDEAIPDSRLGGCFASLAMTQGEILWLAQARLPMHTRAILGSFDFSALRVGMSFQSDGAALRLDNQSTVEFGAATTWQPAAIEPARVAPREVVVARVQDLPGFPKPGRSLQDARDWIGLGEGLTPAGDDFVGGMLFAQWHLRAAYPGAFDWNQAAVDDLIAWARVRTNSISYAILRDHARGQSVEPLHRLVAALLYGNQVDAITPHVQRLLAIGSTSGEDLLAGALTGMLSIA